MDSSLSTCTVNLVGGGPSGLMAAEVIASAGVKVNLFDAMPSVGRKFLLAGIGGMNITHNEHWSQFLARYQATEPFFSWLNNFDNRALIDWIHGLGIETFVGSSNRVFPKDMKAAPLLRAWLSRLKQLGVDFYPRHELLGFDPSGALRFKTPDGNVRICGDATLLALGGGSWAKLGSNGVWANWLAPMGVRIAPLKPSNCGYIAPAAERWRDIAGEPLHNLGLRCNGKIIPKTEMILAEYGVEGTGIYALSRWIREALERDANATILIDLLPDLPLDTVLTRLQKPRGKNSLSNFIRKQLHLAPAKLSLLRALTEKHIWQDIPALAQAIKALPLQVTEPRPLDESISTAGGIALTDLDNYGQLHALPGVFVAGEMLDWDAPTGGYLLTGCFASGRAAGYGVLQYLQQMSEARPA